MDEWRGKRLIAENGGILKDMDKRQKQTLNLTTGGQGDALQVWQSMWAKSLKDLWKVAVERILITKMATHIIPRIKAWFSRK